MELKDKVAVVTGGGGGGCGRAIARRFANDGAKVIVSDIDEAGCRETVRLIQQDGGQAAHFRADARDEQQMRALINLANETFGGLNVLVNNASAPFHPEEPLEHWLDTVQTDLLGGMSAIRFAIDAMKRSGGGAIVNMCSISALPHGGDDSRSPSYDVAKAGLMRLTTALAFLHKENIRVNCLAPGWIASPEPRAYWESLTPEQRKERGVPSRILQPVEVANAIVRLATDESLYGRILVWHSEHSPRLISWADRGYAEASILDLR